MKKQVAVLLFSIAMLFDLAAGNNWFSGKFPPELVNRRGKRVKTAEALNGKMVAVYFSASWCGPCRSFTPVLKKFYNDVAKRRNVEIVLVSSDKNQAAMEQYMQKNSMPWLAVPFDAAERTSLKRECRVSGIPKLVVFSADGKLVSNNARWDVVKLGAGAVDAWMQDDYTPLTYQDYKGTAKRTTPSVNSRNTINRSFNNTAAVNSGSLEVDSAKWAKGPSDLWHVRIDTALAAAKEENKKIFVLTTGSDWCSWCKRLYSEVLSSRTFLDYAEDNLILVYLDYPNGSKQPESQKLYNEFIVKPLNISRGAPAAFILSPDGRLIGNISGYRQLDVYMSSIKKLMTASPKRGPIPSWLSLSPEQLSGRLTELKTSKQNNAEAAKAASEEAIKQMKFQVVAWGFDKNNVNKPFSPDEEIRVPLRKQVYFKVKYQLPPQVRCSIWLRARSSYCGSFAHNGRNSGEFVGLLAGSRARRENKLQISVRLSMPESRSVIAAELPCNIAWGDAE